MKKRKLIDKKITKLQEKKCYFCPCDDYELLDVHRILEGCQGGKYNRYNSLVVCSLCHRKIHAGIIKIDKKYFSSSGKWVLHYWMNNEEKWE